MNRPVHEIYDDGDAANQFEYGYSYDGRGLLENVYSVHPSVATANELLSTYTYDALARPTDVSHDNGESIHYSWDDVGNQTALETRIDGVTQTEANYVYDDLNRIQTVTDESLAQTSLSYDPIGLLSSISRPNGITTNYSYDPQRYFVDEIEHLDGINLVSRYQYDYDNVGNRTQMIVTADDLSQITYSYDYDNAYRLASESYNTGISDVTTEYRYDRAGNRTQRVDPSGDITRYIYNENDELTDVDLPDYYFEDYTYDARGNQLQVTYSGHGNSTVANYIYNAKDQLISATTPGNSTVTYDYDYRGNRVEQTVAGSTTNYLWDEFSRFGDVILEMGVNPDLSLYRKMDYTLARGMLISQTNLSNSTHYFLQDAQNSTVALTDAGTGDVYQSYSYNAFGELQGNLDPLTIGTNYLYTGQQFDPVYTELYSLRARYYDPGIGRFTSRDTYAYNYGNPIELNRYTYAANNPATYTDPSGYEALLSFSKIVDEDTKPFTPYLVYKHNYAFQRTVASGIIIASFVWPFLEPLIEGFVEIIKHLIPVSPALDNPANPGGDPTGDDAPEDEQQPEPQPDPDDDDDDDDELVTYVHFSTDAAINDILRNGIKEASGPNSPSLANGDPDLRFFAITKDRGPHPRPTHKQVEDMMNSINRGIQRTNPGVATGLILIRLPLSVVEDLERTRDIIYRPFFRKVHLMEPGYMESVFSPTSFSTVNQYKHLWSRAF